ncbi:hypothetical protein BD408DRAFT_410407 [Parasitella parasitica]|nr:hypothetical protein BD408DRAFT_410407 [Parasitella parasitica]
MCKHHSTLWGLRTTNEERRHFLCFIYNFPVEFLFFLSFLLFYSNSLSTCSIAISTR